VRILKAETERDVNKTLIPERIKKPFEQAGRSRSGKRGEIRHEREIRAEKIGKTRKDVDKKPEISGGEKSGQGRQRSVSASLALPGSKKRARTPRKGGGKVA